MICQSGKQSQTGEDGGTTETLANRGNAGESCQRRADCAAGLACIEQTCVVAGVTDDAGTPMSVVTKGKRGESCRATNDCESGLSCISEICRESDLSLSYSAKECVVVQCQDAADCCADFEPGSGYTVAQCEMMKANCEMSGQQGAPDGGITFDDCTYYASFCRCRQTCQEELCVPEAGQYCLVDRQCGSGTGQCIDNRCVACSKDSDCSALGSLRPYCSEGACVGCKTDAHCSGTTTAGDRCVAGNCQSGCTKNEQCGLLEACEGGECVDVGCVSDRQCYFLTNDDKAACVDGECKVPCERDSECAGAFQVCENKECKFVGCETDEECRAALRLQGRPFGSLDRAECREITP